MKSSFNLINKKIFLLLKRNQLTLSFSVGLLLINMSQMWAQSFEVSASLDTTSILIGKQAHLLLELKQPKSFTIQWPVIPDTIGKIEIVGKGTIDTVSSADGALLIRRQLLAITAFDSGYFVITPINFSNINGNDTSVISTQPLLLNVLITEVSFPLMLLKFIGVITK